MSETTSATITDASTATTETQPTRRRRSQAIAFGRNYFHPLGGTHITFVQQSTDEKDVVQAYSWDEPPWWRDESNRKSNICKKKSKHKTKDGQDDKFCYDDDDIDQAVCTSQSTLFLTKSGKIYQTGTLHGRVATSPRRVEITLPLKCVQIAAGRHFCLGRMEGGLAVVSWGAGHFGQLGIGSPSVDSNIVGNGENQNHLVTFAPHPVVIERLLPHVIGSSIAQIAAGDWHALALTESGRVWAWGSNRNLQCGRKLHSKSSSANSIEAPTINLPLPVQIETPMRQIAAGRAHSVAVARNTGRVYCWGSSNHGQCGNSIRRSTGVAPPRLVEGLSDLTIAQVAAGGNHTIALTTGGRVFCWGAGSEGELGLGPAVPSQCKPRLVADLDFVAIAAGQEWKTQQLRARQAALSASASSFSDAQTGASDQEDEKPKPKAPPLSTIPRIVSVFAGASYSAAISTSGHVYIWGSNDAGQSGIATPPSVPFKDSHYNERPTSSLRDLHVCTFDSRHNILLPVRIDSAQHINARIVACGPNHLWCIGDERPVEEQAVVGKTMYELQEVQRAKKLQRARDALLQKALDHSRRSDAAGDASESSFDAHELSSVPPSTPDTSMQTLSNLSSSQQFQSPDFSTSSIEAAGFTKTDVISTPIEEKKVTTLTVEQEEFLQGNAPSSVDKSPGGSDKPSRPGLIKRFSWRNVVRRMSSGRSDRDDSTAGHQSDMSSSRRGRGRRRGNSQLNT